MRYRLHIHAHARKQLELAPIELQIKLALLLGAAAQRAGQEEPGASAWRSLDVDGFRILYNLDTKLRRVTVIYVARGSRQGTAAA